MLGSGFRWRAARGFTCWFLGCLLLCGLDARPASAAEAAKAPAKVAVGFSNLLSRMDDDEIGFAKPEYRVHILESLRDAGFNAVGAENLVFNRDDAEKADLVLGGTVQELKCRSLKRKLRCSVGIEWQLLDRERDQIVYRVLSRYAALNLPYDNEAAVGRRLVLGALRSLLSRSRFKALLNETGAALPKDEAYTAATFKSCEAAPRELPADFDAIADSTVIIKSAGGVGSGFYLGGDGLVLTAAHVVRRGNVEVRSRGGKAIRGRVVRIAHKQDVALVALAADPMPRPCMALQLSPLGTGADIYAIGAPAGEELAFSLSRGIVSGLRSIGDVPLIQTDASLSPGNSGGALVDRQGRVIGIVSRKIAGHAVEGLGFAIPIQSALVALAIEPAAVTSPELLAATPRNARSSKRSGGEVTDTPDPVPSLDPTGDRVRFEQADYQRRLKEQKDRTPAYVPVLRWGGVTAAAVGGLSAFISYNKDTSELTRSEYESTRLQNDLSWVAIALGTGAFISSYVLEPKLEPAKPRRASNWSLTGGPNHLEMNVSFQ